MSRGFKASLDPGDEQVERIAVDCENKRYQVIEVSAWMRDPYSLFYVHATAYIVRDTLTGHAEIGSEYPSKHLKCSS